MSDLDEISRDQGSGSLRINASDQDRSFECLTIDRKKTRRIAS